MSPSATKLPPATDDDPAITAPLAVSEARALEKSRLINPTPPPRSPILAPLEKKGPVVRRRTAAVAAAWLLLGGGLAGRLFGVVDTTSVDSVAVADLEPVEDWLERNVGLNTGIADNLGIPRQLASTEDDVAPLGQLNSEVVSVETDDPEFGLSRDDAPVEAQGENEDNGDEFGLADSQTESAVTDSDAKGDFALAWSQWLGAEYSVVGEVTRERIDSDTDPITIAYRAARKGDAAVEQLGSSAVVVSARGTQTCDRDGQGVMLCTPPVDTDDADGLQAVAALLAGPSPTYAVGAASSCPADLCTETATATTPALTNANCWEVTAAAGDGQRWGLSSLFCFDPASKALIARRTTSSNRIETFLASTVKGHVDTHELQPR